MTEETYRAVNLTPYDTGERLEPKPWVTHRGSSPDDDYGKVDFENDESVTELTIHVERVEDGLLLVQVYNHGTRPVRAVIEED